MKDSNRAMLSAMAERLGPLLERVVFVGGCATGLLVTDKTAPPIRTTEDVDVMPRWRPIPSTRTWRRNFASRDLVKTRARAHRFAGGSSTT